MLSLSHAHTQLTQTQTQTQRLIKRWKDEGWKPRCVKLWLLRSNDMSWQWAVKKIPRVSWMFFTQMPNRTSHLIPSRRRCCCFSVLQCSHISPGSGLTNPLFFCCSWLNVTNAAILDREQGVGCLRFDRFTVRLSTSSLRLLSFARRRKNCFFPWVQPGSWTVPQKRQQPATLDGWRNAPLAPLRWANRSEIGHSRVTNAFYLKQPLTGRHVPQPFQLNFIARLFCKSNLASLPMALLGSKN